jgi:hypothetical protein
MPFGTSSFCVRHMFCWCWGHFAWPLKNGQTSNHSSTCGLRPVGGHLLGRLGSRLWTLIMSAPTNHPARGVLFLLMCIVSEAHNYITCLVRISDRCFVFFRRLSCMCPTISLTRRAFGQSESAQSSSWIESSVTYFVFHTFRSLCVFFISKKISFFYKHSVHNDNKRELIHTQGRQRKIPKNKNIYSRRV